MRFEVVSRTHVGLKRKINEDNLLVRPEMGLFVVADGMGGHQAGEVASGMIVERLEALDPSGERPLERILETLGEVNRDLLQQASSSSSQLIGSTVVGLLLGGDLPHCFWAGDSRAYRLRGSTLEQLTRDHSLVQQLIDAGMLEPEQAHDHPNGNMITRAVGAAEELKVDVVACELAIGDIVLLASDGVTRVISDAELAQTLASPAPLAEIADGLVWTVLARGAPDNLTFILLRVQEED
jgi:serine/threonine protein phosphatase PrpC